MRVAIFTDNDFAKVNGVTTTLSAVLRYAPPSIRPRIYTADDHGCATPEYFGVRSTGWPMPFYREMKLYIPRVAAYLRQAQADGIDLVHLTTPGPVGLAAMRVARRLHLPMVGTFHTDLAAYTRILSGSDRLGALMREFMRWPYGRCARVLAPSEATRQLLIGATGDPARFGVWTRGVDTEAFTPTRRSAALREAWGVSDGRPAILYVGRVSREKGLDLLPGLQKTLRARGLPHRFVIAGQGPMLAELRATLDDAVFTGVLDRRQVAEAFASADIFCFPSRTDTAGNVVLEAQASGLPVVVSDAGGPRENMTHAATGFVVDGTSAEAWANRLEPLLRSRQRRAAFGEAARRYGLARSWESALDPLYRTYREVLAAHSAGAHPALAVANGGLS